MEIQTACGGLLMLKNEEFCTKKQVNEAISRHFGFLVRVAQNLYMLRQLHGVVDIHYQNVIRLLKEDS